MEVIHAYPVPTTKRKVLAFVELVGWNTKFIPYFAERAAPPWDRTTKFLISTWPETPKLQPPRSLLFFSEQLSSPPPMLGVLVIGDWQWNHSRVKLSTGHWLFHSQQTRYTQSSVHIVRKMLNGDSSHYFSTHALSKCCLFGHFKLVVMNGLKNAYTVVMEIFWMQ